jgi:hypothetical protein
VAAPLAPGPRRGKAVQQADSSAARAHHDHGGGKARKHGASRGSADDKAVRQAPAGRADRCWLVSDPCSAWMRVARQKSGAMPRGEAWLVASPGVCQRHSPTPALRVALGRPGGHYSCVLRHAAADGAPPGRPPWRVPLELLQIMPRLKCVRPTPESAVAPLYA